MVVVKKRNIEIVLYEALKRHVIYSQSFTVSAFLDKVLPIVVTEQRVTNKENCGKMCVGGLITSICTCMCASVLRKQQAESITTTAARTNP